MNNYIIFTENLKQKIMEENKGTGNSDSHLKEEIITTGGNPPKYYSNISDTASVKDGGVIIKFKKLTETVKEPIKSTAGACGYDVYANAIKSNRKTISIYFGFAVEIPEGYALEFIPRSSICKTGLRLANCVGLIDSDYRGEVYATFDIIDYYNENNYKEGDRVGQFKVVKNYKSKFVEVDELSETKRGDGGFGSTGK